MPEQKAVHSQLRDSGLFDGAFMPWISRGQRGPHAVQPMLGSGKQEEPMCAGSFQRGGRVE